MDGRLEELGQMVRRQRTALNMGAQSALARRAKIGSRKVSDVERGIRVGPKTYDAIARTLDWPEGSIQRYLAGGAKPEAVAGGPSIPGLLLDWTAEEIARVRALTPQAAIAEAAVYGKATRDPERQLEYLHDVYLIRRKPARESIEEPVGGDAAP